MPAANTDKLKKLSRRWVGQIGAAGVADASTTTIPLASTTNLATDTAVVIVVDRVDANGTATPSLEETIIGVVSGSNLVNAVRGAEGTAQAHSAGAVVEVLVTAKGINDIIDGFLVGHSQLGAHSANLSMVTPYFTTPTLLSAVLSGVVTGNAVDTDGTLAGNLDTKLPSQKAVKTYVDANAGGGSSGWTSDSGHTWVYASASTFTIAGVDLTTTFTKGTRLRFKQGAGYKYAVVVLSAFSTDTTVTIAVNTDFTIANAAITDNYYSYVANPQGYPTVFNYSPTLVGFSANPTSAVYRFSVVGNLCTTYINQGANGTSNATSFTITLPTTAATISNMLWRSIGLQLVDNGAVPATPGMAEISSAGTTMLLYKDFTGAGWTGSGNKRAVGFQITYEF